MIKLEFETTFFGPNPFSTSPVIVGRIGASDGEPVAGDAWTQACHLLRDLFPQWVDASAASPQHPMAQVGRVAARWALAALNETDGLLHDAGAVPLAEGARIWLGFHHPEVSIAALGTALSTLAQAARSRQLDRKAMDSGLESIRRLRRNHHPDEDAYVLMLGARALGIPVLPFITGSGFWQYGWGCRSRVFLRTASNADGHLAGMVTRSKILSKMVFAELGIPSPEHRLVTQVEELPEAVKAIGWPCVIKPISLMGGRGVTVGVNTLSEAEAAFAVARRFSDEAIMVEALVPGDDHRLMVIDGRFFGAVRRQPPSVTGNGRSTIAELIAALNRERSESRAESGYAKPIVVDDVTEQHLQRQGVSLNAVLERDRRMMLRGNANRATGGVCVDVTSEVHPHTRLMMEMLARTIGLATTGFDFVTTDISKPWHECGALIEVNTSPDALVMVAAGFEPVLVASTILGSKPGRIPVRLVVTPRSELPNLLDQLRRMPTDDGFGWASDRDAAIGGMPLQIAGTRPWGAVETLLRHTVLQRACLVCSAEAIVRHGMPVDKVEGTVLYRFGTVPLPPVWTRVLGNHSGAIRTCSEWADLGLADFAAVTSTSGTMRPSSEARAAAG
jgi:cyanophycin synthetase